MKALFLAAAVALAAPLAVQAQTAAPVSVGAALGVSDDEIAAMRAVAPQVRQVTQQHQPAIAAAPDEELRGEAQRALFSQLDNIVRARGLSVERYNQIATLAASNPDLARAIGQ